VRGVDAAGINIMTNGVPLNDSESQGVFWANMPNFSSSIQDAQLQRGVGTSSNGSAAFGASLNLRTDHFSMTPTASPPLPAPLPSSRLSDKGQQMVRLSAEEFAARAERGALFVHLVCSPLQRTRESAAPVEELLCLTAQPDERVIEADNYFGGLHVNAQELLRNPRHWTKLYNPARAPRAGAGEGAQRRDSPRNSSLVRELSTGLISGSL